MTTQSVHEEIFGPAVHSQSKDLPIETKNEKEN